MKTKDCMSDVEIEGLDKLNSFKTKFVSLVPN